MEALKLSKTFLYEKSMLIKKTLLINRIDIFCCVEQFLIPYFVEKEEKDRINIVNPRNKIFFLVDKKITKKKFSCNYLN